MTDHQANFPRPGPVVLMGSGETSPSGRKAYDWLFRRFAAPVHIAVLETPAGFQPNSALVAGKVADFLRHRLQNYQPDVTVVPARKRDTPFSPDDPAIVAPLLQADAIFMGPGSPTYAVRQLQDSLAWHTLVARHRQGMAVILASAATIAVGQQALPVYEIYKAGADLHWHPGLNLFQPYGLAVIFVSHWDNNEGGDELDTSRCFMGRVRFERLRALLPNDATIVGIDEHTSLIMDLAEHTCQVMGRGRVTLLHGVQKLHFAAGDAFNLSELGPFHLPEAQVGAAPEMISHRLHHVDEALASPAVAPSAQVLAILQEREAARARRDWKAADVLRAELVRLGWQVRDTPAGPELVPRA